jgi:hypothetical protein
MIESASLTGQECATPKDPISSILGWGTLLLFVAFAVRALMGL